METVPDSFQVLIAAGICVVLALAPLALVWRYYRKPSILYGRPGRAALVLAACAFIVPPAGYLLACALSWLAEIAGWRLFGGDDGLKVLFALAVAALFLLFAALNLALRGRSSA